jgi:hypothetical protein
MRQSVTASARRRAGGAGGRLHRAMAGLLATVLVIGLFGGVLGGVFATEASATSNPACTTTHTNATCTATLTVTPPVGLGVHGNAVNPLAAYHGNPTTFRPTTPLGTTTATVTPKGGISGVTLPTTFYHEGPSTVNTHTTETIIVSQPTAGSASGSVNATGVVTLDATLLFTITIKSPARLVCKTRPTVILHSTSPYTAASRSVALADTTFTVPNFTATATGSNCGLAVTQLNERFAGPSGNDFSFGLSGTLPLPLNPTIPTTTSLTPSPAGPTVAGQTVTLTATVGSGTPGTLGATGATVTFFDGAAQIGTPQPVATGSAHVTTASLSVGTDQQLTAVYSGNGVYIGSTSPASAYTVQPAPAVTLALPTTVVGNNATITAFSVTITNPSGGQSYSNLFLELQFSGTNATHGEVHVQYEDLSGTWCTLLGYRTGSARGIFYGYVAGRGSICTPTYPASFALNTSTNHSLTVPLRVGYPTTAIPPYFGVQTVTATLSSGTVESTGAADAVAPLTGTVAPVGSGSFEVVPPTKYNAKITDHATRKATSTVRQTFNVPLESLLGPTPKTTTTTSLTTLPAPTGTVTYAVDGTTVATGTLARPPGADSSTGLKLFNTKTLSIGVHQLVSTYSGDGVFNSTSLTETFTVTTAPSGTPFSCIVAGFGVASPLPAYVTATSTLPSSVLATTTTTVPVHGVKETIVLDPAEFASLYNTAQTAAALGFSGGQSVQAKPVTFIGTTGIEPTVTGTWTETTPSGTLNVPVQVLKGTAPGTAVPVGATSAAFSLRSTGLPVILGCSAVSAAAPVASVTVAGTTLAVNPAGPVTAGTPVTLTATVYPAPVSGGTADVVKFLDGTTVVGQANLTSGSGDTATGSVTVSNLTVGTHTLEATWSGTSGADIGPNSSAPVTYVVTTTPPPPPPPPAPPVPPVPPATSGGYHLVASNGSVYSYGNAPFYGSMGGQTLDKPIVGTASTPGDGGYWLVASDGGTFSFGNALFYGSMGGKPLNQPIVGMAATPDGQGYWEVASDGGIFAFGDAAFYGSMGGKPLNQPIVGMAATPDGKGYWEVASDGGIFAFGDAAFNGSTGSLTLNKPIVGMAATNNGGGYWLVASDGGVFAFGNAGFFGTVAGTTSAQIVSLVPTTDGGGYWETASSGQVFQFGDATSAGTALTQTATIVAMSD